MKLGAIFVATLLTIGSAAASADDFGIKENGIKIDTAGADSPVSITTDASMKPVIDVKPSGNNPVATVNSAMKTSHDTAKNSIGNVRAVAVPVVNNTGDESPVEVTTNVGEAPAAGINTTRSNIKAGSSAATTGDDSPVEITNNIDEAPAGSIITTRSNIKSSASAIAGTTGDDSPVDISIDSSMGDQTGVLDLSGSHVETLSATSLSATISGNSWLVQSPSNGGSDPVPGCPECVSNVGSGDVSGTFSAQGGIANVQQNTGANAILQGSVSLAMKPPVN
ncbi:MAG: hypothetical protein AB7P52_06610 [Alphaproteobacteria bacterium]